MNGTRDTNETAAAGHGGEFDPREAAALFEETRRQAQRQFETNPTWLWLIRAAIVLVAYGAIWLSVRGHHPYQGPSALALVIAYVVGAVSLRATFITRKRAIDGIRGRSQRLRRAEIAAVGVPYAAVYFFMGALLHDGASHAIVYGVYPATAPLIVVGAAVAGVAAGRGNWTALGLALAAVAVGTAAAFAGPVGAWAVAGAGLFVAILGYAAVTAWLRRA
jgi:hypothetical protein